MPNETAKPAEVTEQVKGKTTFGFGQIGSPTPLFITNIFRVVLYLCGVATLAVGIFTTMPEHTKVLVAEICSFITLATHSASKMFGIQLPDTETKN